MIRLMGIDPGLRFTGWGVIEAEGNRLRHVADGVLATDNTHAVPARLKFIHDELTALFPAVSAAGGRRRGDLRQPQRGGDAEAGLCTREWRCWRRRWRGSRSPNMGAMEVKRAVVGTGAATKDQVEMMVRRLLPAATLKRADAGGCARGGDLSRASPADPAAHRGRDGDGVIALLTGRVEGIEADRCIIDVGGVGYLVQASTRTLAALAIAARAPRGC